MRAAISVGLPLLLAYAVALWWVVERWWTPDGYYSHGPLVPLVALFVLWSRRADWSRRPTAPDQRGWWLLGPALGLHLCGVALMIDSLSAASLVLAIPGAAWLIFGRERLRGLWPVLWLPLLTVPLPIFVTGRIAFALKEMAVTAGLWLANITGLDIVRDGAELSLPDGGVLEVADPCGGLRSLLAMVALAYCIAFFMGPPLAKRRIVILVLAGPLALLVNVLRIAAICWVAHWFGIGVAVGWGHDALNLLAWVADLVAILAIDNAMTRTIAGSSPLEPTGGAPLPAAARLKASAIVLWIAVVPLLALSLYRPFVVSAGRSEALPPVLGDWRWWYSFEISPRYHDLLGTGDASWRTYVDGYGNQVFLVAVFHEANWKSVHPPHICLEGSNMVIVEDGLTALPESGQEVGRIVTRSRGSGSDYLSLYVFGARELATASYWSFFWHHAPDALFRASTAGFLLRVETFVGSDGVAAAERRCADLLERLLPSAQELLR